MDKTTIKKRIYNIFIVPVAIIIGTVMMLCLYSLPTTKIKENIIRSASMYDGGPFSFVNWGNGKRYTELSNYTDTLMMNTASFRPTNSIVENAMISAHAVYPETDNPMNMIKIAKGEDGYSIQEYSRYWHGYLLYMIPALQFMEVGELKILGQFLQFFLMLILAYQLGKRSILLMLLYGIVALFINPVTTVLTFQDADIYLLMMISMIIILRYDDKLKQGGYFSFFMLNGILVAFFDFLTYPLVAFGVPLILSLLLDEFIMVKDGVKKIVSHSIGWIIGYVGMWMGKWIVASILTGRNMFSDALLAIEFRTHGDYHGIVTYRNTLSTIWKSINNLPVLVLLLCGIGIIAYHLIRNNYRITYSSIALKRSVCFFLIGLFPFLWFYVAMNHTVIHPHMSYRELAITIWAIAAIAYTFLQPQKDRLNNGYNRNFDSMLQ